MHLVTLNDSPCQHHMGELEAILNQPPWSSLVSWIFHSRWALVLQMNFMCELHCNIMAVIVNSSFFCLDQSHEAFSSYSEKVRGALLALCDEFGRHELSLHCGWRDIIPKRDKLISTIFHASPSILAQAQPSVKTSVKYTYHDDDRDNPMLPCYGSLLHCRWVPNGASWWVTDIFHSCHSTEIAGLYGDVKFVKTEIAAQKHKSFGPTMYQLPLLNFSLSSRFGLCTRYASKQAILSHSQLVQVCWKQLEIMSNKIVVLATDSSWAVLLACVDSISRSVVKSLVKLHCIILLNRESGLEHHPHKVEFHQAMLWVGMYFTPQVHILDFHFRFQCLL